jgi:WhiB family transcriptional regulator, redox-sensing transcriptional regulator
MAAPSRTSSLARLFATEPDTDWRAHAACKGYDPELFFSSDDLTDKRERVEREAAAKAVCMRCTVRRDCLDYAIAAGERYGIWGGLNPQERRAHARTGGSTDGSSAERVS